MSTEIAIPEVQEVQGKALTVEQSVEFKLRAHKAKAAELKALIAGGVPTIAGIGDKALYTKVSEWRKSAMRARTALDSDRKGITEDARKFQALVNSEAKLIAADIESVENALFAEENRIDKLIAEDKAAKQKVIDDRVQYRTNALLAVNGIASVRMELLAGMGEENFQAVLQAATTVFNEAKRKAEAEAAELARLQAEEAERARLADEAKAEAQRVETERLAAQKKAQDEAQARLDAQMAELARKEKELADKEAKRLADEKAAKEAEERKAREAIIAKEAAERAKAEAEAKAKAEAERKEREAKEAEEKRVADERAKAEKLAAIEAAKPDVEKLRDFADFLRKISLPALTTEKGENVIRLLRVSLDNLKDLVNSEADKLTK
jgi:hypothetical protein